MNATGFDDLVVLEVANNHMGDVEHGKALIRAFAEVTGGFPAFRYAIKFQYRDISTFIHPDYRERFDLKYVKRFSETALPEADFMAMKKCAEQHGFLSMCTPFDEISVDRVVRHGYDYLKIASCSFNDWPLLEKIAEAGKPVIVSTAGAEMNEIDQVAAFFEHRGINFAVMHCVGSYPTPDNELELNQIDLFRANYPGVPVGFSTHERPDNFESVMLAVAKGATLLERHVALPTEKYSVNAYSSTPEQVRSWLSAATRAKSMCGVSSRRRDISAKEKADLQGLQRGVFVKRDIAEGESISRGDLFFAIPRRPGQLRANDLSKYLEIQAASPIAANAPVLEADVKLANHRDTVLKIVRRLSAMLTAAKISLGDRMDFELSHHYGLENFEKTGCAIITCVNREYCKKIIIVLPGQTNPTHTHLKKEETFHVLSGTLELTLNGKTGSFKAGELAVVERGVAHSFSSPDGVVLEEISTTHIKGDSIYADPDIAPTEKRKTYMTFYSDWLKDGGDSIR